MAIPHSPATWGKQQAMCWYLLSTWFPNWCMDAHRPKKSYHMGSDTFPIQTAWRCQTHTKQMYLSVGIINPTYICLYMFHKQWVITNHHHDYHHHNYIICFDTIFWWLKIAPFLVLKFQDDPRPVGASPSSAFLSAWNFSVPFLRGIPQGFWWINELANYPLVNKHRPWKSLIFNGN